MTPTFVVADRELLAREADLIALRRQVHRQPELAFHEHGTAEMVAERLEACGLQVRRGVAGTGVVAVLSGGRAGERAERVGRAVAWRADLDALPIEEPQTCDFSSAVSGVMHACGHDGHTALAVVLAESLAAVRDTIAGEVVFLFQPAEETFRGATRMLAEGVLDAPPVEAIFGLHLTTHLPAGEVSIGAGVMWAAADLFEIEVRGQGAHGAYPHLGRSPIPAAVALVSALQALVPLEVAAADPAVLSIGRLAAGEWPNVVPERASIAGSLRTLSEATRQRLMARIREVTAGCAAAHRVEVELHFTSPCALVHNEPRCAALAQRCASAVLGPAAVHPGQPSLASDDMSAFLAARPGCYFRAGIGPRSGPIPPHHSAEFWMDERGLLPAARVALRILLEQLSASPQED
jgi:amidohydrolase